jgi:hypothetical protein
MADDPVTLAPSDYDPWQLASPLQLLHLIQKLGITSRVIARWLGVKPAAISLWSREHRPIPLRYGAPLLLWAHKAMDEAYDLMRKEAAGQPTDALRQLVHSELMTIYTRWQLEVLHSAGTLHQGLQQQYDALGRVVSKPRLTAEDRETMALMMEAMLAKVDVLLTLEPEAPSAEDALIERLTQAHEAVHPTHADEEPRTP